MSSLLNIAKIRILAAAKDAKRAVRHGERDLEKELRNLERSEKSLVLEIKKTAKGGNQVRRYRSTATVSAAGVLANGVCFARNINAVLYRRAVFRRCRAGY